VEDKNVVLPLLVWRERVLDNVAANRCNRLIEILGGFVPQPESVSYLPHEVHHSGQELGIGRNPNAGDGSLRFRLVVSWRSTFIGHGQQLPTDSSAAPGLKITYLPSLTLRIKNVLRLVTIRAHGFE
jgi:hypothetical protein